MLALVPWGVRGLYGALAIEQKAYPPTMGGESPCAIKHPAIVCLAVIGEVFGCQRVRDYDYIGKEVDVR